MIATAKNTDARIAANRRYDAKTYKRYSVYLRVEDDADIIASIEEAKKNGYSIRDWLKEIFEGK